MKYIITILILLKKIFNYLFNIEAIGEEMAVSYDFAGWDVVDELDVVWKFLNGWCWWDCFVFCFRSSPFLIFGFNLLICRYSFSNFGFQLPFFRVDIRYFYKRFEFGCSTPANCEQSEPFGFDCSFLFSIYSISCDISGFSFNFNCLLLSLVILK